MTIYDGFTMGDQIVFPGWGGSGSTNNPVINGANASQTGNPNTIDLTGGTDSTAGVLYVVDNFLGEAEIYWPGGIYKLSAPIPMTGATGTNNPGRMRGAGTMTQGVTIWRWNSTGNGLHISNSDSTFGCVIDGMCFQQTNTANAGSAIFVDGAWYNVVQNCLIGDSNAGVNGSARQMWQAAINEGQNIGSYYRNIKIQQGLSVGGFGTGPGKAGVWVSNVGSSQATFDHVVSDTQHMANYGSATCAPYVIDGGSFLRFISCPPSTPGSGVGGNQPGYYINAANSILIASTDMENANVLPAVLIDTDASSIAGGGSSSVSNFVYIEHNQLQALKAQDSGGFGTGVHNLQTKGNYQTGGLASTYLFQGVGHFFNWVSIGDKSTTNGFVYQTTQQPGNSLNAFAQGSGSGTLVQSLGQGFVATAISSQSSAYTLNYTDLWTVIKCTATLTITIPATPAAGAWPQPARIELINTSASGTLTVTAAATVSINGNTAGSITASAGQMIILTQTANSGLVWSGNVIPT